MTTANASFTRPTSSYLVEILQVTMVAALIAGMVGFLVATWSPQGSPELRAERPVAAQTHS
jgi:hypothetical protein